MEANDDETNANLDEFDSQLSFLSQGFLEDLSRIEEQSRCELEIQKRESICTIPQTSSVPEDNENDALSKLSEEQREVYDSAIAGYSMFFTGDAGTGKSYVLRQIVTALKDRFGAKNVYVTASTGIAACNIGGTTLHSFAGIGVGDEIVTKCVRRILQNKKAKQRWQTCEVLIVDEISMLDGRLFEKLEAIARRIRGSDVCFGGIQVIVCGDFFQLPPVGLGKNNVIYCFESECWNSVIQMIVMKRVFRQKDTQLQALLRDIRYGHVSNTSQQLLQRMTRTSLIHGTVMPTKLFAYNKSVDEYNNSALNNLTSSERIDYKSIDEGDPLYVAQLQRNCQAPSVLTLMIGAQVMLLKNLSITLGLVNGSRGVIERFVKDPEVHSELLIPIVRFITSTGDLLHTIDRKEFSIELGSKMVARRLQLPLKLAWGISIHKSQGMTIDLLDVDLNGVFESGMTYVALSRGVAIDRMCLHHFSLRGVMTNPKVIQFYKNANDMKDKICVIPVRKRISSSVSGLSINKEGEEKETDWLAVKREEGNTLPCSFIAKKPFLPPCRGSEEEKEKEKEKDDDDLETWQAMYLKPYYKEIEVRPRNRIHDEMVAAAEQGKNNENPHLPMNSTQNVLIFQRMTTRRQLLGSLI